MVSEQEKRFVIWWAENREKQKKSFRNWLIGLPLGMAIALPVAINYSSHWYKRADMWALGHSEENTGLVVMIAGLIIVVFVAIFYKRHRWDMYEQQYREILSKMPENERPGEEPPVQE